MPRTPLQAAAFLLGLWIALWLSPLSVRAEPAAPAAELERALVASVNAVRREHHRIALERVPALDRVARAHSADMARRGYLSHDTPEGLNPVDRLAAAGASGFSLAAENVGSTTEADPNAAIVRGWLASPTHRSNLIAPAFNATGVGIARAPDGSYRYTQIYVTYPR